MKNVFVILTSLACFSCDRAVDLDQEKVFARFRAVVMKDDFSALAGEAHPEVLNLFRKRLEFSTELAMPGSWFTGTEARRPTKDEMAKVDDRSFFVTYMKGVDGLTGNHFIELLEHAKVVDSSTDGQQFMEFVILSGSPVETRKTLTFRKVDGKWLLVAPSIVDHEAYRLRPAFGGLPEK